MIYEIWYNFNCECTKEIIRSTLACEDVVVEVALHQNPGDFVALLRLLHGERAYNLGHLLAPEEQLDGDRVARVVELDLGWKESVLRRLDWSG